MSKELEVLERMIDTLLEENKNKIEVSKANNYDCELLEERRKDLKSYKQALSKSQEQEKVLEIIINKKVDVGRLFYSNDLDDYNEYVIRSGRGYYTLLIPNEYKAIMEVLTYENQL